MKKREFKVGDIVFATVNDTIGIVLEVREAPGAKASESMDWSQILKVKLVNGDERWVGGWDPLIITAEDNMTEEEMNELKDFLNKRGDQ